MFFLTSQLSKINIHNEKNISSLQNGNDSNLGLKLKNNNNVISEFSEPQDKNSSKMNKIERLSYPMSYYFCEFVAMKLRVKNQNFSSLPERFRKSFSLFTHIIDISSYLKLFKNFENIQKMVANQNLREEQPGYQRNDSILSIRKNKRKISGV